MKSISFKHIILVTLWSFGVSILNAQEGFGTDQPNKSTVIELKSDSRGLLIPRIELEKTDQFSPITSIADQANSLLVYNTATKNDVTPGYYYWSSDKGKWLRVVTSDEISEPGDAVSTWFDQETGEASINITDKIYHLGATAIGKEESEGGALLDVAGAIRGGNPGDGQMGENTLAVGVEVEASGDYSIALGFNSQALGLGSFAGGGYESGKDSFGSGIGGIAKGNSAFAFGYDVKADSSYTTAFGYKTQAKGAYSFAIGRDTRAEGYSAIAMGRNTGADGNYSFAIGQNSYAKGRHSVAMGYRVRAKTKGEVIFGRFNNLEISPNTPESFKDNDPLFVLGNGEDVNSRNNALTILKSGYTGIGIDGSTSIAKPSEMLDIGKGNVRIRTLPDNQGDAVDDKIVVVDGDGILKSIEASESESNGPWYAQSSKNPTVDNEADIYQNANVGIGKDDLFVDNAVLDVAGSIHGGETAGSGNTLTMGQDAIAVGHRVVGQGDFSATFGYKSEASGEGAFAGGGAQSETGGEASGKTTFAFGYNTKARGNYSAAFGQGTTAENTHQAVFGRFNAEIDNALFTIGNGSSTNARKNRFTLLKDGKVGIGLDTEAPTQTLDIGSGKLRIRDLWSDAGNSGDKMVVVDKDGILKTVEQPTGGSGGNNDSSGTWFDWDNPGNLANESTENIYHNGLVGVGYYPKWVTGGSSDPVFLIGRGTKESQTRNAVTVLKNGWVGIGYDKPTTEDGDPEMLKLGHNLKNYLILLDMWIDGGFDGSDAVVDYFVSQMSAIERMLYEEKLRNFFGGAPGFVAELKLTSPIRERVREPTKQWGEKLRVNGSITASEFYYPDYVFEHYFDGKIKDEKVNYQFNSLKDVKWYIKNFKHLPGIMPAWALNKTEDDAYEFNLSGLSVQTLEKVEELFLYTIEQEEKIEALEDELGHLKTKQKEELKALKNENKTLTERMDKLEKLLLVKEK